MFYYSSIKFLTGQLTLVFIGERFRREMVVPVLMSILNDCSVTEEPPLSGPLASGTLVVWAALVACSLLTIMKFG